MIFKNFFEKFKSEKGAITGPDVALSVVLVAFAMGVCTAIFVNANTGSKENIRYSNSARIGTEVLENIEAKSYDELVKAVDEDGNFSISETKGTESEDSRNFLGVKVPNGYGLEIKTETTGDLDILRNITITVKYKISNKVKDIVFYTSKKKEILEETNSPDLSLLPSDNDFNYYPIKLDSSDSSKTNFYITSKGDKNWYNYSKGNLALVYKTNQDYSKKVGSKITISDSSDIYAWIPRFSGSNSDMKYLYGTSNYEIRFGTYGKNGEISGYTISGITPSGDYWGPNESTANSMFTDENKEYSGIWETADTVNKPTENLNTFGTYLTQKLFNSSDLNKLNIP